MARDTKERILAKALELFSQNGYERTNIKEIMVSLELVKSAMYRHFESKEEIWNTLLDRLVAYYEDRFGSPEHLPPVPESLEELLAMTMRMVNFTVHDETVVMTRKLLTIEQYRDERAKKLATKHFLTGLTEMFTHVFSGMMDKGLLRRNDPELLAFSYTAPISVLIHLCDREPEKTDDALARIEAFAQLFISTYGEKTS
jgi:AcrR family transcriptional regulator